MGIRERALKAVAEERERQETENKKVWEENSSRAKVALGQLLSDLNDHQPVEVNDMELFTNGTSPYPGACCTWEDMRMAALFDETLPPSSTEYTSAYKLYVLRTCEGCNGEAPIGPVSSFVSLGHALEEPAPTGCKNCMGNLWDSAPLSSDP
jgi:hypothetical protein